MRGGVNRGQVASPLQHTETSCARIPCLILCIPSVLSPFGVFERDVVQLGPARKHLFFCDEAVVVSPATTFIHEVRHTFVRPPGLVVVVGHLRGHRFFSTVIWWNHPINFDVVTHLNGYNHCEPASAQPRVGLLSVPACLFAKQVIEFPHFR